ncbi:Dihydroxyacetone kinase [Colletotrichum spinosum]|uniref:Dihydroxyacetone kinase n=1 Tax=Colletotrichum spinosum TaxID=1347390 RepID=A0A4R8Q5R9_9PEZI|nr:Dihydroxyacetone kinase [Colletotrichum spinosum]
MSIMGGGGSGHEPAWSGFVREGLWSAVACGDIFASSSTKQVLEALGLALLDAGVDGYQVELSSKDVAVVQRRPNRDGLVVASFANVNDGEDVTLLVNNYDGLSVLSWGALTDEVQTQLASTWNLKPARLLPGTFKTFLNAQGFSISLVNISATARQSNTPAPELLRLLDRHTTSVSWPNTAHPQEADHTKGLSVNVNVRNSAQKTFSPPPIRRSTLTCPSEPYNPVARALSQPSRI